MILVLVANTFSLFPKWMSIPKMSLIFRHHHHLLKLYLYHNLGSCNQHILVVSQMNINHQDVFTLPSSNFILNIILVLVAISLSLFPKWMSITKISSIFHHHHHLLKLDTYHNLGSSSHLFLFVSQMNVNPQDVFKLPSSSYSSKPLYLPWSLFLWPWISRCFPKWM